MAKRFGNYEQFSVSETAVANLEADFRNLLESFSGDAAKIGEITGIVVAKYAEEKRFYHNLSHVAAMLSEAENSQVEFADGRSVRLAIWFHDAVYNAKRSDNEAASARLAAESLNALGAPTAVVEKVVRMISATHKHDAADLDADGARFLDLDLAILGADADVYGHYRRAIRGEYSFVPWFLYRRARSRILENFLERETIYFTAEMREKFERRARENIANELKELS